MRNAILKTAFTIPLLWISTLSLTQIGWLLVADSRQEIENVAKWVVKFKDNFHHLPGTLADIRLFAKSIEEDFSAYDSFGTRLQYIALNEQAYLVKSFGPDASENRIGTNDDEVVLAGVERSPQAVIARTFDHSLPIFFQSSFLEGSKANGTNLIARLEVNASRGTRYLLIQDPDQPRVSFLSFHDAIEEFLWLPSGYEIIFTAEGSDRYEDGIFYWNLKDGETHNLLGSIKQQFWPKLSSDKPFYFSLSHISSTPPMLYVVAQPKDTKTLSPRSFYRFVNLFAISIDKDLFVNPIIQKIPADPQDSSFDYPISHLSLIKTQDAMRPAQHGWQKLTLDGDAETVIDQWQSFCSLNPQSPMFPYGLWWLASIYNDTYRLMKDHSPDEALVIRNYGIEIAEALAAFSTAPSYLRAMALHLKKSLLLSDVADYSVSSPTLDP